jgi:superfamily II DNA/RNA helicase
MKGIAITLATREDAEAVAAIEKLTGIKIARVGKTESVEQPAAAKESEAKQATERGERSDRRRPRERTAQPDSRKPRERTERTERTERPKRSEAPKADKPAAPKAAKPEPKIERSPVVEDIADEWNGPMPSFLSKSAS